MTDAQKYLEQPTKGVPLAVVMAAKNISAEQAAALLKKNKNFEVFWQLFDRDEVFKADLDVDEKDIWCYKCKLIHRPEGLVYVRKKDTTVLDNFINSSLP